MQKILPKDITSYDLLKTFAVISMVVDHIGFYLFPDQVWWRYRFGAMVWFFLAGFGNARAVSPRLWGGALILTAADFVAGMSIFPLNVLFTNILIRKTIDAVMRVSLESRLSMLGIAVMMLIFVLPSIRVSEYGTEALIIAMFGYAVRRRAVVKGSRRPQATIVVYMFLSLFSFVTLQFASYAFTLPQFLLMIAGSTAVSFVLYKFRPMTFPRLTAVCPAPLSALIRFTGRHTLEIYVFHLLALKALALHFQPQRFTLFGWRWFYQPAS